jgi:hypothetical protein
MKMDRDALLKERGPIPRTCEHVIRYDPDAPLEPEFCGKPTKSAYPAMGGGWQANCAEHEKGHESYSVPI